MPKKEILNKRSILYIFISLIVLSGIIIPISLINREECEFNLEIEPKEWTIMSIISADNPNEHAALDALQELELGFLAKSNVSVIAYVDRNLYYDSSNGDWAGVKYFEVQHDTDTKKIGSLEVQDKGELSFGNYQNLRDFINWTMSNYPAKHYALSYIGHGLGFNGLSFDVDSNSQYITMPILRKILSGFHFDIIALDGCGMGMIEVAYQMAPYTDYIVHSETVAPQEGFDYEQILQNLIQTTPSPQEFAIQIAQSAFYNIEYEIRLSRSVVETSALTDFVEKYNVTINELIPKIKEYITQIQEARTAAYLTDELTVDVGLFLSNLLQNLPQNISDEIELASLLYQYNESIIYCQNGQYNAELTGLSMYLPEEKWNPRYYYEIYRESYQLKFLQHTGWKSFVDEYIDYVTPIKSPSYPKHILNFGVPYMININETQREVWFELTVEEPTVYNFTLSVVEGDMGLYVLSATSSPLEPFGELWSQTQNPEMDDKEKITAWLEQGQYYIFIMSLTVNGTGILSCNKTVATDTQISYVYSESFAPRRGGTGPPISCIFYYYDLNFSSGRYHISITASENVLLRVKIWDLSGLAPINQEDQSLRYTSTIVDFRGNEGQNFNYFFSKVSQVNLMLEIGAMEWTGSFSLKISPV